MSARHPANVALPEDPVLLRMIARILEKRGEWDAMASVLSVLEEISPKYWRTGVQLAVALENSGDAESARTAIVNRMVASRHTAGARRGIIEQLFGLDRSDLFLAAIKAYADGDPKSLRAYVLRAQGSLGDALMDAIRRLVLPGLDPLEIALSRIEIMENAGRWEEADHAIAAIEPSLTIESAPTHATPTTSTLMFRNTLLLETLVCAAEWFIARNGNVSIHVGACSTGEEVYSLAILLADRGLIDRCTISASDVDPVSVRRAITGVIESKARSAIPETLFQTYFELGKDGRPKLRRETLQRLSFSVADLSKQAPPGVQYDLLIANNMLVHFPVDAASVMLGRVVKRVQPNGVLCIGGARQDGLEETIGNTGLVAVTVHADAIFDGWRLQRHAWYINPRRYWALPPARHTAAEPWRHSALFARSEHTARALDAELRARTLESVRAG